MTTSLGKRSSVNGISDIAYKDEKAPIYTSTDQFVQGTKTFSSPAKFLNNVLCSGSYYGDGSHLTNVTGVDPSKLPLTGGTLTGPLLLPSPNQSIEISEIGIRTSSLNGESKLNSDVLYVHPGQGVRAQLASTSLDFNNDGNGKYVSIGTNTMIGNVDGLLVVNGNTGASAVVGLETASAPIVRLADSASGTETVALLTHQQLQIQNTTDTHISTITKDSATFEASDGLVSHLSRERLEINDGSSQYYTVSKSQSRFDDGPNSNTQTATTITLLQPVASLSCDITGEHVQVSSATYTAALTADIGLQWSNNVWGGSTTYAQTGLTLNGADYNTNHTISGMSMERPSTGQLTYVLDSGLSIANSQIKYKFQNDHQFMKWDCGTSFRITPDAGGTMNVEKDDAFKVSENGNRFEFYSYDQYLDDNNNAGWSVLLSNLSGGDIDVNSPDCQFYAHSVGITGNPFPLKKHATARFTLVPSSSLSPGYAWAVSMY